MLAITVTHPSGISRRIQQCIERLQFGDDEGALFNLFPAIDKTAKKRRPKNAWPADKSVFRRQRGAISVVATGNVLARILVNGASITDALYKFGCTSTAHEGEPDPRLRFNDDGAIPLRSRRCNAHNLEYVDRRYRAPSNGQRSSETGPLKQSGPEN